MKNILVTGGAGFIGSHIAFTLLEKGYSVWALDNFSTGKLENLNGFKGEVIEDDLSSVSVIRKFLHNYSIDAILHQAAIPSVKKSVDDPHVNVGNNINSTLNMLEAARVYGKIKRIVVASSSSVYGDSETLPKVESMPVLPLSPYALSKYFTERIALQYGHFYNIPTAALRYFNVFGPRQDPNSPYSAVIVKFIKRLLKDEAIHIYGDGEQTRDFTYIDDVVKANIMVMESSVKEGFFNIACERRISVNDLIKEIFTIAGKKVEVIYDAPRPGDVLHSLASIKKATDQFDFKPEITLEEGLLKTYEYLKSV